MKQQGFGAEFDDVDRRRRVVERWNVERFQRGRDCGFALGRE